MMNKVLLLVLFLFASCSKNEPSSEKRHKIGLCIVATGRYDLFAEELIASARPLFCTHHDVTYFVFTDGNVTPGKDVVKVYQKRLGWPYDTLKRFHIYDDHKELLKNMDYLFAIDADMRFVAPIGEEILGNLVGTIHPGYITKQVRCERNKKSTAYVPKKKEKEYFAGGFYGGKTQEFLKLVHTLRKNVDKDLEHAFIAHVHDESHLNRYFLDHRPSILLSPSYCHPEGWEWEYEKKIVALDKNHSELRK